MSGYRRRVAERIMTGFDEVDDALIHLEKKAANRIARTSMTAAMRPGVKAIKQRVKWKSGKKAIGQSVKRGRSAVTIGKLGAGVGIKKNKKLPVRKGKRPGVGLSARNIHWPGLGTKERRTKKGRRTGRMPQYQFVKEGVSASMGTMKQRLIEKAREELAKEANRVTR